MGSLELRFDKQHLGIEINLGVVARVRQIKDAEGNFPADPADHEVVIPAGARSTRTLPDIPAGTYRIEARLPSGEVLRETRTVADAPQTVIFEAGHSPNEWLSWQRFAGNVPSQQEYETWLTKLAEEIVRTAQAKKGAAVSIEIDPTTIQKAARFVRDLHLKIQPAIQYVAEIFAKARGGQSERGSAETAGTVSPPVESVPATQEVAPPSEFELVQIDPLAGGGLWATVASLSAWTAWRRTASIHDGLTARRTDDRQLTLWRIQQVDRTSGGVPSSRNGTTSPRRCLAVMRRGDGVEVIALPVPWPLAPEPPAAEIQILREAGTSESGRTTTTVCDDSVGSLIMYLNNGQIADAATVLAEAGPTGLIQELMSDKSLNPLAACAAAYVGIATLSGDDRPRWASWLVNLETGFEWIPDGAIVRAAYLIRTAQTRGDLEAALVSFKAAYRRGIPFYTAGLQHLMNGLDTFSAKDAEAKVMYEAVRAVASRVDRNQAFTQITIAPASP
jgi:hypothetical protein